MADGLALDHDPNRIAVVRVLGVGHESRLAGEVCLLVGAWSGNSLQLALVVRFAHHLERLARAASVRVDNVPFPAARA